MLAQLLWRNCSSDQANYWRKKTNLKCQIWFYIQLYAATTLYSNASGLLAVWLKEVTQLWLDLFESCFLLVLDHPQVTVLVTCSHHIQVLLVIGLSEPVECRREERLHLKGSAGLPLTPSLMLPWRYDCEYQVYHEEFSRLMEVARTYYVPVILSFGAFTPVVSKVHIVAP